MEGLWRWGGGREREIIYLSLHCHHQNDSCIKMGCDESHFNVSVGSDGQSQKTVSTTTTSTETIRLIRDGEKGGGGYCGGGGGGEGERLSTYRYTVTTRMTSALI